MRPTQVTQDDKTAIQDLMAVLTAVVDIEREFGSGAPEGPLYLAVSEERFAHAPWPRGDMARYEAIVGALERTGLITRTCHLVRTTARGRALASRVDAAIAKDAQGN